MERDSPLNKINSERFDERGNPRYTQLQFFNNRLLTVTYAQYCFARQGKADEPKARKVTKMQDLSSGTSEMDEDMDDEAE